MDKKVQYRYNLTPAYFCGFMAKKYVLLLEKTLNNYGIKVATENFAWSASHQIKKKDMV